MSPPNSHDTASRLTKLLAIFAPALILFLYVAAYAVLRSQGTNQSREFGSDGIFYVSLDGIVDDADFEERMRTHRFRRTFFAPLNWLDVKLLGGPFTYDGGIRRLSAITRANRSRP